MEKDSIVATNDSGQQSDFGEQRLGRDPDQVSPYLPEIHGPGPSASSSSPMEQRAFLQTAAANEGDNMPSLQIAGADTNMFQRASSETKNLDQIRDNDLMNAAEKEEIRPFLQEKGLPLEGPKLDDFLTKVHRNEIIRHLNNSGADLKFDATDEEVAKAQRDNIFEGTKQLGIHDKNTIEGVKSSDPKVQENAWNKAGENFAKALEFGGPPKELYNFANPVESLHKSIEEYLKDKHQLIEQQGRART